MPAAGWPTPPADTPGGAGTRPPRPGTFERTAPAARGHRPECTTPSSCVAAQADAVTAGSISAHRDGINTDDPVFAALAELTVDRYPLLVLLPRPSSGLDRMALMQLTMPAYRHPARPRAEAAILDDPDLKLLFPARDDDPTVRGWISTSLGTGFSIQSSLFPSNLLRAGYVLMRLRGELELTALLNALREEGCSAGAGSRAPSARRASASPVGVQAIARARKGHPRPAGRSTDGPNHRPYRKAGMTSSANNCIERRI